MFQSGAQNSEALKHSLPKLYSHKLYNYNALHTGEKKWEIGKSQLPTALHAMEVGKLLCHSKLF